MFKRIALAVFLSVATPVATAHAAGEFLFGLVAGGMLFGGNNQYGGSAATILYSADDETLGASDPLSVRMAATQSCFNNTYVFGNKTGWSLGELFAELTEDMPAKERTILQIVRTFYPDEMQCAAIWFAYVEQ